MLFLYDLTSVEAIS